MGRSCSYETFSVQASWKMLGVILLLTLSSTLAVELDYRGAVPCPTDSSLLGYNNLTAMNEDIMSHFNISNVLDVDDQNYTYYLCPETTFVVENIADTIVPLTDKTTFSCGIDGKSTNNCVIKGGNFQVYFLDLLRLFNITFLGITFDDAEKLSVYGDAHPESNVKFVDCIWQNMRTIDVAFVKFSPYQPNRRLAQGGEHVYKNNGKYDHYRSLLLQKYDHVRKSNKERKLQNIMIRYSMIITFERCQFKNNINRDTVIYNEGGEIGVFDTLFESNTVQKYALFTTTNNGHAYLGDGTMFAHNNAPLGPVFVGSRSFLQYSVDSTGYNNTGACASIFIENRGQSCFFLPGTQCIGTCCAFDDTTCDFHPDTKSPTEAPFTSTTSPTASPVARMVSPEEEFGGGESTVFNQIEEESSTEESSEFTCTGFCISTAVLALLLALVVFIPLVACMRRRKLRKEVVEETQTAAASESDNDSKEIEIS